MASVGPINILRVMGAHMDGPYTINSQEES